MAETYRVLVTGSRDWRDYLTIQNALHDAYFARPGNISSAVLASDQSQMIVVHGACPRGADAMAQNVAEGMIASGFVAGVEPHPADWNRYGKSAGYRRNAAMVAAGADLCLAFLMPCIKAGCATAEPHMSHGTTHCATQAADAGIPVRRFCQERVSTE